MRDALGPLGMGSMACTPRERASALAWFCDASITPVSFRWLCLALDLDPDAIVQRLGLPNEGAANRLPPRDSAAAQRLPWKDPTMAETDVDDLVTFRGVRIVKVTATALLCAVGDRTVWLPREHVTGRLFSKGDRGTLRIRRWVALDRGLVMPRPTATGQASHAATSPRRGRHGLHVVGKVPGRRGGD